LSIGRLKPDVLLYGKPHLDNNKIMKAVEDDSTICPGLMLIVGIKLRIPGAQSIAEISPTPLEVSVAQERISFEVGVVCAHESRMKPRLLPPVRLQYSIVTNPSLVHHIAFSPNIHQHFFAGF